MAFVASSTALGAIILCMLSFWIYHIKYSSKSNKKKFQSSDVAIKRLNCECQYAEREFENEVELLSKIQHPNVISLLGCSSHEDSRTISWLSIDLAYEDENCS
ncbi:hypothetical protein TSUD_08000 [Trifolium subterraneum]|nr:hypothetical protein TSUD_08000 [Trifolium subterraneum]